MTVLVTGATGFVGAAVVRRLAAAGEKPRVLVRPTSDRRNLAGLAVEVAEGDLTRPETLAPALQGCRALYHVAADYRLWVPDPEILYRTNVAGTEALMRAALAAGVERIVYTSSVATLGLHRDGRPADETTPVRLTDMIGHYKRSKYQAEALVSRLIKEAGLPAVIVNPAAPVGPGDIKPTPTGRMILEAARGAIPAYVDTGLNVVHVDDVAEGHILAMDRGRHGERYILGGTNLSLREILARVTAENGRPAPRIRLPRAPLYPLALGAELWARISGREPLVTCDGLRLAGKHMYFTSAKAAGELGYRARPAETAIADAVAWFRAAGYLS